MRIYEMKCVSPLCSRDFAWTTKSAIYDIAERSNFREVQCWHCGRFGAAIAAVVDIPSPNEEKAPTAHPTRDAIEALLRKQGEMRLKDIVEASGLPKEDVYEVVYKNPGDIVKTGWGVYGLTAASSH
jgi:hypothetical protein